MLPRAREALNRPRLFTSTRATPIPERLIWALAITVLFHGALLAFGTFRGTYDAYVHMFLGDHYARDWFSTWDQRWYTGFTTVSYPPGVHMTLAALSKLTGSLETAFVLTQVSVLLLLNVGIYRFSRLWVNPEAAANAALLGATGTAIAETVHLYGQLPTTFALAFLLNSLPSIRAWVFDGRWRDLFAGITILAACTAGHHVTTLFGSVFFLGPILVAGVLQQSRIARSDELGGAHPSISRRTLVPAMARRLRRAWPALVRSAVLAPCILVALIGVVLPYWLWSASDPISQIPIPHGSRSNFIEDPNTGLIFFLIPWGLMLVILPYALARAVVDRMWPLAASIGLLFVLGTGGTTPIPKLLLGGAFDILTLDRFTFWAAIQILPLAGLFVTSLEKGSIHGWLQRTGGPIVAKGARFSFVVATIGLCLFTATLSQYRPFQPDPIVAFLEKDDHERWRYLTLGFGDQMSWLSAQTTATQVDGNYHSVRRLPELTSTSVERLEGAKYRGISGLGSLQQFLEVPEKYHLKYVFSNDRFYDPLLFVQGWQELGPLENGIVVWERADIEPLPAVLPVREIPNWQRVMWGTIPPGVILAALGVLGLRWTRRRRPNARSSDETTAVIGPARFIDRRLHSLAKRLPTELNTRKPAPWGRKLLVRARLILERPIAARQRAIRISVAASLLLTGVLAIASARPAEASAEEVVADYYDHLDFRRFREAYELLDPVLRPDYELWRLQLSVEGGLIASYSSLDELTATSTPIDSDRRIVEVSLRYLTALDFYSIDAEHPMVRRDGSWYVVPPRSDIVVPPDQLVRRPTVDYLIQGRRQVTSLASELTDIQDRPQIAVRGARLIEVRGLPLIVGEVVNLDVDPADITLTGVLRDANGEIVARYNATDRTKRTLNPKESSPFVIEFEAVAAGVDIDFDPLDFTPIQLDGDIEGVELYAKAVVTSSGLNRDLQVISTTLNISDDGAWRLQGEIRNDGTLEAVLPVVFISYLDDEGHVLWVDRLFVPASIRPQRSRDFSHILALPESYALSPLDVVTFHNGVTPEQVGGSDETIIAAPTNAAYAGIRIDVITMLPPGSG